MTYKELREHMLYDPNPQDFYESALTVQRYMPIGKKYATIDIFTREFKYTLEDMLSDGYSSIADMMMEYEMKCVFDILFKYVNEVDFDYGFMNSLEYDLIQESGFYAFVIDKSCYDYAVLKEQLDQVVGIRDLSVLGLLNTKLQQYGSIDFEKVQKDIDSIDLSKLKDVETLLRMHDPLTATVADAVKAASRQAVKKEMQQDIKKILDSKAKKTTKRKNKKSDTDKVIPIKQEETAIVTPQEKE